MVIIANELWGHGIYVASGWQDEVPCSQYRQISMAGCWSPKTRQAKMERIRKEKKKKKKKPSRMERAEEHGSLSSSLCVTCSVCLRAAVPGHDGFETQLCRTSAPQRERRDAE